MSCVLLLVGILVMQVTDRGNVDKIMVKISGDGAKFSSSSSFLLTFSLPGTSENVLSSAGMCMYTLYVTYIVLIYVYPTPIVMS